MIFTMIIPSRRGFLLGIASFLAAPAIVRAASLMPVSVLKPEPVFEYTVFDLDGYGNWIPSRIVRWVDDAWTEVSRLKPDPEPLFFLPPEYGEHRLVLKADVSPDSDVISDPLSYGRT